MFCNIQKIFVFNKKYTYLCKRYPEYNLFTLKKLIPIEINVHLCEETGIFCYMYL